MTIGDKITTGLRDLADRLASGETIEATTLRVCAACGGYRDHTGEAPNTCPDCGGSGYTRERVELTSGGTEGGDV